MDVSYLVQKDHVKRMRHNVEDDKEDLATRIVKWLCSLSLSLPCCHYRNNPLACCHYHINPLIYLFIYFLSFYLFIHYGAAVGR